MRLEKVRLRNVCQFRDLEVEFHSGLNVVIGPNGCGKSNFVNSIYTGLTNDFSRYAGVKSDQVSQYAKPTENSFISLDFEHANSKLHIHRGLKPSNKYLTINGGEKITSDKDIISYLNTAVGISSRIFSDYVFVNQWQLFAFLIQKESDRAKALQHLFGIDKAEVCWKAIGDHLALLSVPQTLVDEDSVKARRIKNLKRWHKAKDELFALEKERGNIPALEKELAQFEQLETMKTKLSKLKAQWVALHKDHKEAEATIAAQTTRYNNYRAELEALMPVYKQASRAALDWQRFEELQLRYNKLKKELSGLDKKLDNRKEPERPARYVEMNDRERVSKQQQSDLITLENAKSFMESFSNEGGHCPVCDTYIDNKNEKLVYYKAVIPKLESSTKAAAQALNSSKAFDDDYARFNVWKEAQLELRQSVLEQLSNIDDTEQPDGSEAEFRIVINNYKVLTGKCESISGNLSRYRSSSAGLVSALKIVKKSYGELLDEIKQASCSSVSCAEISNKLLHYREVEDRRYSLIAEIKSLRELIKADDELISEATRIRQQAKKVVETIDHLSAVRDILHREALPKAVSQHYIDALNDEINDVLEVFDASFKVKTTNDLGFRALFHDGRDVPAAALSGGQKAVFAIAFRIVINSKFASEVGLLCLDEPTAGLDRKNIGCLTIALERLKYLSKSRGLQCIIITHEESLTPHFDKVIEL